MLEIQDLLVFIGAGLLLNLVPGPDMLYIIARSLAQGFRAGLASTLGISAGCAVHACAAAFGVSVLLKTAPAAYELLRLAGAAYLVWLGYKALRDPAATGAVGAAAPMPLRRVFLQGLLTNVLNPKVALFFLAFLPQFASPARGSVEVQMLVLGAIFIFNGAWVCLGVAVIASRARHWLTERTQAVRYLQGASGAILIALGLRLALDRSR
jgi:threonine/homoserine/homoserine lactone efflux protein